MFSKALISTAIIAMNANAIKLKTGLQAGALAGVNIQALSKAELEALKNQTKEEFVEYEASYSKHYITEEENQARQTLWLDSKAKADTHNADPKSSSISGENRFSDQTESEKAQVTGTETSSGDLRGQAITDDVQLEGSLLAQTSSSQSVCYRQDEFRWGDDVISPIKDQKSCGSCYAFSAVGVLEGAFAIKHQNQVSFAEQKFVDCKNTTYNMNGCNGGSILGSLFYASENPIPQDSDYGYTGNEDAGCHDVESSNYAQSNTIHLVNPKAIYVKYTLCNTGPITAVINVPDALFGYSGGVLNRADCPPEPATETLHGVVLIGWSTINGVDAVIMRNSWGTGWGNDGYAYMELTDLLIDEETQTYDSGVCGMYREMSYATVL